MKFHNLNVPETRPHTPLKVYCDASHREAGMSHAGWAFCNHNGRPVEIRGQDIGKGYTSIEAECQAIIRAVEGLSHVGGVNHLKVYSDSIHAIRKLKDSSRVDTSSFECVKFEWVPREENQPADVAASAQRAKSR